MNHKMFNNVMYTYHKIDSFGSYESWDGLKTVIAETEAKIKAGELYEVTLVLDEENNYTTMALFGYRKATAEEIKRHEYLLALNQKSREAAEAKEFARLKKKFEP
jgi:hypothetical protein